MKNKLIIRQGIKVIIITLIVGTSCLSPNQPYNVPEQEMNVQDLTSTQIHKATNLPTTNLEATSHLILTNEYIGTPLPTIHPNDVGNFVRALYLKCSLPCWGSITPGKTSEMETKYLLSP